ncbi:MTH1187 family thiamine-binding protein [Peribacillus sp. SCS-37]|uniref:thiamine-binding protein n=1 Tax=Paraperibacillus esterisolvens TaxID=3115296 RepID=UPI003905C67C
MAEALVSVQIIPKTKNLDDVIPFVDEAIAVIEKSGVNFQVQPLETTMEGSLSTLLDVVKEMNEKMTELGARNVITQMKILYQPEGITMDELTGKYR